MSERQIAATEAALLLAGEGTASYYLLDEALDAISEGNETLWVALLTEASDATVRVPLRSAILAASATGAVA